MTSEHARDLKGLLVATIREYHAARHGGQPDDWQFCESTTCKHTRDHMKMLDRIVEGDA